MGSKWRCFLGYLGPLEISLKLRRGYDFHTLEMLFAGMISRLDQMVFCRFSCFLLLVGPLLGSVLGQKSEKMEYGKTSEKVVEKIQAGVTSNSGHGHMWSLKRT